MLSEIVILLFRSVSQFALLMFIFFAAAAFTVSRMICDTVFAGLAGLAGVAAAGYSAFWLWFLWPKVGHLMSFLLPLVAGAVLIRLARNLNAAQGRALRGLFAPLALMFAAALFTIASGFLYGGFDKPLEMASIRFSHRLPSDNALPFFMAEDIKYGRPLKPFSGDWRSSDRPPLQTGLALLLYPYTPRPRELGYTILGSLVQSFWILALWLLLLTAEVDHRASALIFCVTILSGFALVNTFFVWPKLLGSAYVVGFSTLILVDKLRERVETRPVLLIVAGSLAAFSMLAHGGSGFSLIALVVTALVLRIRMRLRSIAIITLTCLLTYAPWTMYQKFFDPPGDRLLKMHLAGVELPDSRSFVETIISAYEHAGPKVVLSNKWENVKTATGAVPAFFHDTTLLVSRPQSRASLSNHLRFDFFFFLAPVLGFLLPGLLAIPLYARRRTQTPDRRVMFSLALYCALIIACWCLLMFGPGTTFIHQGTYVIEILALTVCVLGLWTIHPATACVACFCQVAVFFLVYFVFPYDSTSPMAHSAGPLCWGNLILACVSLAAMLLILARHAGLLKALVPTRPRQTGDVTERPLVGYWDLPEK